MGFKRLERALGRKVPDIGPVEHRTFRPVWMIELDVSGCPEARIKNAAVAEVPKPGIVALLGTPGQGEQNHGQRQARPNPGCGKMAGKQPLGVLGNSPRNQSNF